MAKEAEALGAQVLNIYNSAIKGFAIKFKNQTVIDYFGNDSRVKYMELDTMSSSDQQSLPTGINRVDGDFSSAISGDGRGSVNVDIAIIDSGIAFNHQDLNVYRSESFVRYTRSGNDDHGHGTHVAGIAAAKDNGIGVVVGVAPGARLWALKACDNSHPRNLCQRNALIAAVNYVHAHGGEIEVVNYSLGGSGAIDPDLRDAINRVLAQGVVFVVSAGNDRIDARGQQPANFDPVITVSSIDDSDGRWRQASR